MKIFSVAILLLISFQVCGQDIITRENDAIDIIYRYWYQESTLKRKEVKVLIVNSQDPLANKYLKRYETESSYGWIFVIYVGGSLFLTGITLTQEPDPAYSCFHFIFGYACGYYTPYQDTPGPAFAASAFLIGAAILSFHLGKKSFKKSINRFNSIQQSNLKVDINRNGVGLSYNF